MVRESFGLSRMDQEERKLPGFRLQQWFFFVVATFYLYFRCEGKGHGGRDCVDRVWRAQAAWLLAATVFFSWWWRSTFTLGTRRGAQGGMRGKGEQA